MRTKGNTNPGKGNWKQTMQDAERDDEECRDPNINKSNKNFYRYIKRRKPAREAM